MYNKRPQMTTPVINMVYIQYLHCTGPLCCCDVAGLYNTDCCYPFCVL